MHYHLFIYLPYPEDLTERLIQFWIIQEHYFAATPSGFSGILTRWLLLGMGFPERTFQVLFPTGVLGEAMLTIFLLF